LRSPCSLRFGLRPARTRRLGATIAKARWRCAAARHAIFQTLAIYLDYMSDRIHRRDGGGIIALTWMSHDDRNNEVIQKSLLSLRVGLTQYEFDELRAQTTSRRRIVKSLG
jgi:hypothetical protein